MDLLKVEKDGRQVGWNSVEWQSVEWKSVEWDEIGREAFGLMVGWEQIVEGLGVLMGEQHLHLVKVGHIPIAYVRRRQAEEQRLNHTDYLC